VNDTAPINQPLGLPDNAPVADPADVEAFVALLAGQGWLKTPDILARRSGWSARYVRCLGNASAGRVISGTAGDAAGYRLTLEATLEEIQRCENSLLHRCAEMKRRVCEIRKVRCQRADAQSDLKEQILDAVFAPLA